LFLCKTTKGIVLLLVYVDDHYYKD
jgi:hypothetical protein